MCLSSADHERYMHDMALFFIGPFDGCRSELFQTSMDLQLVCLVMDYITWSSMNVNRDTVNDFSLIGRFAIDSIRLVRPTSVTNSFDLPKLCKFVNTEDFKRVASILIHWEGDSVSTPTVTFSSLWNFNLAGLIVIVLHLFFQKFQFSHIVGLTI